MDISQLEAEAARLDAEWKRIDPDRRPLTSDEFTMMKRWEDNIFPEDQERLTSKQTRDLLNAWAKMDRLRT